MAFTILRPHWWQAGWVFVAGMSLWLRMAFPIMAIGPASHDDMLFVRQAAEIGAGNWLGSYSSLTHAKGMAYSLFLLLNQAVGLPLKLTEHVLYLAVSLYFAATLGRLYRSRGVALAVFVLLAFVPTAWIDGVGGRVVREGLYGSLALLLLALGVRCCVLPAAEPAPGSPTVQLRQKWPALLALGAVAGLFWLTREEGAWLLPAMLVLAVYWLWRHRSTWRAWKAGLAFMALPLLACLLVLGSANALNYAFYGVFRNNDLRSGDFQAGYAALTGIRQDHWQRYVPFPLDARQRAYEMSFAARELRPYFEGEGGESWRRIGCEATGIRPCDEILSGWFVWALREAVAQAGHYRDARTARAFYRRLAAEIEQACRERAGDCLPRRESLVPPWRPSYAVDTAHAAVRVFVTLATLGKPHPSAGHSWGTAEQLALFDAVTHGPLAPVAGLAVSGGGGASRHDAVRWAIAAQLATVQSRLSTVGLPLAFAAWLVWLGVAVALRRSLDATLVVATALAVAVLGRMGLLAFLEATAMPGNNMLYLAPVVPISLAMIPVMLWGSVRRPQI